MFRFTGVASLLLSGLILPLAPEPAHADGVGSDRERTIEAFDKQAFLTFGGKRYVAKWQKDIRIGITGKQIPPAMLEYFVHMVADAREATHHTITMETDKFNVLVIMADDIQKETEEQSSRVRPFFLDAGT